MISARRLLALAAAALTLFSCGCSAIGPLLKTAVSLGSIKLVFSCVPEGVKIDTPDGTTPIESIRAGDYVIGYRGDPVKVTQAHAYAEDPAALRFYRIQFEGGATVAVCDRHRIGGQRAQMLTPGQSINGSLVESVEIFGGVERSYDLLTEDEGYRISGLPVNSMIEEMARTAAGR
jgi:hypothetical protein